ncbi:MAG TPA: S-adenosylmethionine decarboxylase [Dehalococcoidia bacterium]|nr:S-adenosylmethionine decarboxylase [Dehalococcoidia bacterium]
MHLTIDGFGGDRERLSSEALVSSLLDRFPGEINMTKISVPHVQLYVGEKPEDWGVSGFVIIAESHIAVHTFPEHGYVWADIFSCKEFEAPEAVDIIVQEFGLTHVKTDIHERGLEYPHQIEGATPVNRIERVEVTTAHASGRPAFAEAAAGS